MYVHKRSIQTTILGLRLRGITIYVYIEGITVKFLKDDFL